jgi:hypothetical protein
MVRPAAAERRLINEHLFAGRELRSAARQEARSYPIHDINPNVIRPDRSGLSRNLVILDGF